MISTKTLKLHAAEILTLCDSFSLARREFYFDRSPRIFENILGLYRKGELHLTESVCPRDFLGELEYWGLSSLYLGRIYYTLLCSTASCSFIQCFVLQGIEVICLL